MMLPCGIWPSRRGLVAVVVDEDGRASPAVISEFSDDARWGLLEQLDAVHGIDCELVLPEELARADSIGRFALARGHPAWVAPQRLVDAIRAVAALATGPPARTAAMIARLALVPAWRGHLCRLGPPTNQRQLRLL